MKTQTRIAAQILKCGENRIYIDPSATEEVSAAMTRGDIRKFIGLGFIKARPIVGTSRGRVRARRIAKKLGRSSGQGKRKGAKNARTPKKEAWMSRIRAQRTELRWLRDTKKIDASRYRRMYNLARGGSFKSVAHMRTHLKENKK